MPIKTLQNLVFFEDSDLMWSLRLHEIPSSLSKIEIFINLGLVVSSIIHERMVMSQTLFSVSSPTSATLELIEYPSSTHIRSSISHGTSELKKMASSSPFTQRPPFCFLDLSGRIPQQSLLPDPKPLRHTRRFAMAGTLRTSKDRMAIHRPPTSSTNTDVSKHT